MASPATAGFSSIGELVAASPVAPIPAIRRVRSERRIWRMEASLVGESGKTGPEGPGPAPGPDTISAAWMVATASMP